jgi:hypothetical protein
LLEQKHAKSLQEMKVKNLIDSAIVKNECDYLKSENDRMKDRVGGYEARLSRKDRLILDLKERIGHMSRRNSNNVRFSSRVHQHQRLESLDESSACVSLNESIDCEERLCPSPSPVPREPLERLGPLERQLLHDVQNVGSSQVKTPSRMCAHEERRVVVDVTTQRRCWTAPQSQVCGTRGRLSVSPEQHLVSPENGRALVSASPLSVAMSEMSVEGVVDRANDQVQTLLKAGSEALHPPQDETALALDDTRVSEMPSELQSALVPFGDILGANDVIPFLEKTSEDLRHAEEQVHGVYQDLEAFGDGGDISDELNKVKTDNEVLRSQVEGLMHRYMQNVDQRDSESRDTQRSCDVSLTARSSSVQSMASPPFRSRSVSPPPPLTWRRPSTTTTSNTSRLSVRQSPPQSQRAPQVAQPRGPAQEMVRRGPDGGLLIKVGETRTELWRRVPESRIC